MFNAWEVAHALANFYGRTRGVGHTTAVRQGADETRPLVLAYNHHEGEQLYGKQARIVSMTDEDISQTLSTQVAPLVVDNNALFKLLDSLLKWRKAIRVIVTRLVIIDGALQVEVHRPYDTIVSPQIECRDDGDYITVKKSHLNILIRRLLNNSLDGYKEGRL